MSSLEAVENHIRARIYLCECLCQQIIVGSVYVRVSWCVCVCARVKPMTSLGPLVSIATFSCWMPSAAERGMNVGRHSTYPAYLHLSCECFSKVFRLMRFRRSPFLYCDVSALEPLGL